MLYDMKEYIFYPIVVLFLFNIIYGVLLNMSLNMFFMTYVLAEELSNNMFKYDY